MHTGNLSRHKAQSKLWSCRPASWSSLAPVTPRRIPCRHVLLLTCRWEGAEDSHCGLKHGRLNHGGDAHLSAKQACM